MVYSDIITTSFWMLSHITQSMSVPWTAPIEDTALAPQVRCYTTWLAELPSRLRQAGQDLLRQIGTAHWYLEWHLPRWLGAAYKLPAEVTDKLVLSNVYGLAYIRLQDNLFDGELEGRWEEATALASSLYQQWMCQYRSLFNSNSPFWPYLDRFNGQWLRASLEKQGPGGEELRSGLDEAVLRLAERGAPLKICCAAACLLSGQGEADTRLLAGISYHLAGAVMVDHAEDWQEDLEKGHYNALAAFLAPKGHLQANRQAILEELYLGDAARPYFELARRQFQHARDCVSRSGLDELDEYLSWAEAETAAYSDWLAETVRQKLHEAAADLLRPTQGLSDTMT